MKKAIPKFPEVPELNKNQIEYITNSVFIDQNNTPNKGDIIFVFGGSHPGLWKKAYEAYEKGLGNKILTTGGSKPHVNRHPSWNHGNLAEAWVIADKLMGLGVPEDDILIEEKSINSLENISFGKEKIDLNNINNILFVCKSYASGRQYRTMRKNLPSDMKLIPYVFDTNIEGTGEINKNNWMESKKARSLVFGEYLRIICYGRKGDLVPLENPVQGLDEIIKKYC